MGTDERLDSWKEIAGYLKRGVRTAQRWERTAGLPVRRVAPDGGAVYAFRAEIDAWWQRQSADVAQRPPGRSVGAAEPPIAGDAGIGDARPAAAAYGPERVRSFLSHAIDIDPDSAPAHANLAVYFFTLVPMGLSPPEEGMPAARAAAQRALDLDPANAVAHSLLAVVSALYDYDWHTAGRWFDAAFARGLVPATARFHYAVWYLSPLRRHTEALQQLATGLRDDPVYLLGRVHVAMELFSLARPEQGFAELGRVLEIDPRFGPALGFLGREHAMRGRVAEASAIAEGALPAMPRHPNGVGFRAGMLRQRGNLDRSRQVLERCEREFAWCAPRAHAESHVVCGEYDAAAKWIERAIAVRDPGIWLLLAGSAGESIRSTARWRVLRQKLHLPER